MSVEPTSHLAAHSAYTLGDPVRPNISRRILAEATGHTFPALVDYSISTFCGIVPLVFRPQLSVLKYILTIMSMVVLVGMLTVLSSCQQCLRSSPHFSGSQNAVRGRAP
jgi:hypothetical protein